MLQTGHNGAPVMPPPSQQQQLFDLPSGAKLAVTIAPFRDAWALTRAALATLKGLELNASSLSADVVAKFKAGKIPPEILTMLLDRVVDFTTSPDVENAIWRCADRALYIPANSPIEFPGSKVNQQLMDDPNCGMAAREDYAQIITRLLEVNVRPFLAKALSSFIKPRAMTAENADAQK